MAIEDRKRPLDRLGAGPTIAAPSAGKSMLIDRLMPSYDAVRTEHRIVPGDVATVYTATRQADVHPCLAAVRRRPAAVRRPRRR
jgi:hypothetical protein